MILAAELAENRVEVSGSDLCPRDLGEEEEINTQHDVQAGLGTGRGHEGLSEKLHQDVYSGTQQGGQTHPCKNRATPEVAGD